MVPCLDGSKLVTCIFIRKKIVAGVSCEFRETFQHTYKRLLLEFVHNYVYIYWLLKALGYLCFGNYY